MNELSILENVNAVEVFSGKGLDDLLKQITEEAKSLIPDLTTEKSRGEIASMAHKVAKSKTYLDGLRKDLVSEWKTKAKAVDSEGKKMRDTLDALKLEVRQPLTEWEEKEESRVKAHESNISEMRVSGEEATNNWDEMTLGFMAESLAGVESENIEDYEEFAPVAAGTKDRAITQIKEAIAKRETYDKEQSELEKLRAESVEREQKEVEEKLRLEGEKRAKVEAEDIAKALEITMALEAQKAEKDKQEAIYAKNEAEEMVKRVEKNAIIQAENAAKAERDRIEQERINEELAAKKREANKNHKAKINNAAAKAMKDSLMAYDTGENALTLKQAKLIVTAIAKGQIPYTAISY